MPGAEEEEEELDAHVNSGQASSRRYTRACSRKRESGALCVCFGSYPSADSDPDARSIATSPSTLVSGGTAAARLAAHANATMFVVVLCALFTRLCARGS